MTAADLPDEQPGKEGTSSGEAPLALPVDQVGQKTAKVRDTEIESLVVQARAFTDQAELLRTRAGNNIRWIVATVFLMTVLVVILPPLIGIVEDGILWLVGKETSKFDFLEETRNQAIEVQTSSRILSRMLEDRDAAVKAIRSELTKPYQFFEPEIASDKEQTGEITIEDVAQLGELQVAVGGARELDDFTPVVFVRTSKEEKAWRLAQSLEPGLEGAFTKAVPFHDGVLIAGAMSTDSVWLVSREGDLEQLFETTAFPNRAPDVSQVATSEGLIAFLLGPDESNASYVVVTDEAGQEVFTQRYGMGEVAKDIIWSDQDLLVLTNGGFSTGDVVHRYTGFSIGAASVGRENSGLGQTGGLRFVRNEGALSSISILAFEFGFFDVLVQQSRNTWAPQTGQSFEAEILEEARGRNIATSAMGTLFFGGKPNTLMTKPITSNDVASVNLDSQLVFASALQFRFLNDGKLRLMALSLRSENSTDAWSLYTEARPPELPVVQTSPSIVSLLAGVAAGETSSDDVGLGDRTAASEGVSEGDTYLGDSIVDFKDALQPQWIISAEAVSQLRTLDDLARAWVEEWKERERAATILARLRQADEAGSLFNEVSSLVARLAVIALLIYLVNILVNLYRYNMRLAAFYQAQGNAIELAIASGADVRAMIGSSFKELAAAQTPETVSFGARPAPPTETVLKTLADVAKMIKP